MESSSPTPNCVCSPACLCAQHQLLLEAAADGDVRAFKWIAAALDGGKGRLKEAVEAVRYLGVGALHVAASHGSVPVCAYLVEELRLDVDVADETGGTPLTFAVREATVDTVNYLLDHGANPNKSDNEGFTPLHLAVQTGDCEIVKILLSKGVDVDPFSDYGTPLHIAATLRHGGIVKILLDHHANCNKVVRTYHTPLIMALSVGSLECVKLLVKAGADVKGIGSVTPLIVAANKGLTNFYTCLLEAGADPDVPDDFGNLPIEIAAYNNNRKDVEILFPVTSRIPCVGDWSVDGIISYVKSKAPMADDHDLTYKMKPDDIKLEASKSYKKKDYHTAMKLYSMAMNLGLNDATLYSNRSLCWLKMGRGDLALMDAQTCRLNRPDWPKACYLQGAAQMLLKDYEKACDSFLDGLKLDPRNVEIENSLRNAFKSLKTSYAEKKGH